MKYSVSLSQIPLSIPLLLSGQMILGLLAAVFINAILRFRVSFRVIYYITVITLGVRSDHLALCENGIRGTVDVSELMGSSIHLHVTAESNVAHVFIKESGKNLEW